MQTQEIITVGGGTGSPIVHQALFGTGKVERISAIAAVYDSGGATGRRRLDVFGHEIAFSDPMRILLSLISGGATPKALATLTSWLTHRDTRDKVLGQDLLSRRFDRKTGFAQIEKEIKSLGFEIRGHIIPSSTEPAHIKFTTASGRQYLGEHQLDDQRMSADTVKKISLEPDVAAFPEATEALRTAGLIIIACGSFYGSALSNFLPQGMKAALQESKAPIYLVTNLVSTRNETHQFTPFDFLHTTADYIGKRLTGLIVPNTSLFEFKKEHPETASAYAMEHSHFLGWTSGMLDLVRDQHYQVITHDATNIISTSGRTIIRHDPTRLAKAFSQIL